MSGLQTGLCPLLHKSRPVARQRFDSTKHRLQSQDAVKILLTQALALSIAFRLQFDSLSKAQLDKCYRHISTSLAAAGGIDIRCSVHTIRILRAQEQSLTNDPYHTGRMSCMVT